MKTSVKYICVADTETGGLPDSNKKAFDDIALSEVAMVVIDCEELKIVDEYSATIAPYKEGLIYDPKAVEVNGLSKKILEESGSQLKDVYKTIKSYLTKYKNPRQKAILCGHNFTGFDMPFFENMFTYFNENIYDFVKWVEDTQKLAYFSMLESENYKLSTCCLKYGIDLQEAHRALADTRANALLMIEFIKNMRGSGKEAAGIVQPRLRDHFKI